MSQNLVKFYKDNNDLEAASSLLLGTSIAMIPLNTTGTGDAHSIARSVGGRFHDIHHGTALAVILPHVLNFNIEFRTKKLADLAVIMGLNISGKTQLEAAQMLVLSLQKIRDDLGLPVNYLDLGLTIDCLDELAEASKYKSEHGSNAGAAPRKATIEEYKQLMVDAYNGVKISY
jgi:alcohol dehydrogenase